MNFNGIKSDDLFLLAINRFNDSKEFYEENKEAIKEGVVMPLRRLVADLTETMHRINPDIIVDPVRCISRIRRDTRYTHDKSLYRENIWVMFRHVKNQLPTAVMWLEIKQNGFEYGCGVISTTPAFMEYFRECLSNDSDRFLEAIKPLKRNKFILDTDNYKRSKADTVGITGELKKWYDSKDIFVIKRRSGIEMLDKPEELLTLLKKEYKLLSKLYKYLHEATIKFNSENM
ncbi:MAG: DUF2461 domain-containing protein [Clostridia bacterium]|nr:DUF2461 domain-containing protein [Clostridia bacterium]